MEKTINYKNKSVFYTDSGIGETVVLIHGVPEDHKLWNSQSAMLEKNYRLLIPDLPGSGLSELLDDTSIDSMSEVVKAILDAEAVTRAVMIGHSMGGYISLAFAEKYPASVTALGLFHSTAYADGEEKKTARKKNIAFIQNHGSHEFIKQSTPGLFSDASNEQNKPIIEGIVERYKDFNPASLAAYQQAMMDRPDRRHVLEKIVTPVLFIIGEHDKAISFQDSMEQCHIPALSYIHILKKSGHMGMLEEVEKSTDTLEMFLKDIM